MRALGVVVAVLAALALLLALVDGATWSGWAYTLSAIVVAAGCLFRKKRVAQIGLAIFGMTMVIRLWSGAAGRERMSMTTTAHSGARLLGRILDERDWAVPGARLMTALGLLRDPDAKHFPRALASAYDEMRATEGDMPSPNLPTYLGVQRPSKSDVVIFDGIDKPRGSVIFLHGYAGNFTFQCWLMASVARQRDLITYCPSTSWRGDWWSQDGALTVAATIAMARKKPIFLAGLSNGAVGAAKIAERMSQHFAGLILISGASSDGAAKIPTIILQGRHDQMFGPSHARAYAARTGAHLVEFDGGHFIFLTRKNEMTPVISKWLAEKQ
jgi:predicted alpha/beta hydrolase family esterase